MPKTRLSISLDPEDAQRIKDAARRAGQDVSGYVLRAALDAVQRDEWRAQTDEVFADFAAEIAEAERLADELPWPPPVDRELSPAERAAIKAQWDAFFGRSQHGAA